MTTTKTKLSTEEVNTLLQKVQDFHQSYLDDEVGEQFENAVLWGLDGYGNSAQLHDLVDQLHAHVDDIQVSIRYIKKTQ